ncbi:MAG TPA: HAMP domain-containing histidine kinase [Phycisphaerales bacterium]|nr:HAMP domain-containing histidine kinase [Phycisphaerales bacterium]
MKRPEKGQAVLLADSRARRRPVLLWYEQRAWFWVMAGLCAFVLASLGFWQLAAAGSGGAAIVCGALGGAMAAGGVVLVQQGRFRGFHAARAQHRVHRVEKELERFLIVLLRGLRLPLRTVRAAAERLGEPHLAAAREPTTSGAPSYMGRTLSETTCPRDDPLDDLRRGLDHIDALAAGMLRLARARRADLRRTWVNVNALVVDVVHGLDPLIQQSGATVHMQDLPACLADADLLRQLFEALLRNALEYFAPNRPPEVRIWGWTEGGRVVYCVQDNGIGIAEDEIDRIFEVFYRVGPSSEGSRGLGLAVARRVIEQHAGRFWVHSRPGRGSTFSFALPVK